MKCAVSSPYNSDRRVQSEPPPRQLRDGRPEHARCSWLHRGRVAGFCIVGADMRNPRRPEGRIVAQPVHVHARETWAATGTVAQLAVDGRARLTAAFPRYTRPPRMTLHRARAGVRAVNRVAPLLSGHFESGLRARSPALAASSSIARLRRRLSFAGGCGTTRKAGNLHGPYVDCPSRGASFHTSRPSYQRPRQLHDSVSSPARKANTGKASQILRLEGIDPVKCCQFSRTSVNRRVRNFSSRRHGFFVGDRLDRTKKPHQTDPEQERARLRDSSTEFSGPFWVWSSLVIRMVLGRQAPAEGRRPMRPMVIGCPHGRGAAFRAMPTRGYIPPR